MPPHPPLQNATCIMLAQPTKWKYLGNNKVQEGNWLVWVYSWFARCLRVPIAVAALLETILWPADLRQGVLLKSGARVRQDADKVAIGRKQRTPGAKEPQIFVGP